MPLAGVARIDLIYAPAMRAWRWQLLFLFQGLLGRPAACLSENVPEFTVFTVLKKEVALPNLRKAKEVFICAGGVMKPLEGITTLTHDGKSPGYAGVAVKV